MGIHNNTSPIDETALIEGVRAKLAPIPLLAAPPTKRGKRKYRKGEQIKSIIDLIMRLGAGDWVYLHGQPKHPSILMNMSLNTLIGFCRYGAVFVAEMNEVDHGI
jgi:hypothetical protein